jgi:hypothetical protein
MQISYGKSGTTIKLSKAERSVLVAAERVLSALAKNVGDAEPGEIAERLPKVLERINAEGEYTETAK